MSTQRGNVHRHRPPKHANTKAFKNNLHDASKLTEKLNQLEMNGLCRKCKAIIEWKIKYKKYKPLTKPGTCVKCNQRNIKRAYYTMCKSCIANFNICGKCAQETEIVVPLSDIKQEEVDKQFLANLRNMRERERRTIYRIMESKKEDPDSIVAEYIEKLDLSPGQKGDEFPNSEGSDDDCSTDDSK